MSKLKIFFSIKIFWLCPFSLFDLIYRNYYTICENDDTIRIQRVYTDKKISVLVNEWIINKRQN